MTIQEQIEATRLKHKITMQALEDLTGIRQSNISALLKGKKERSPKLETIEKLCAGVGLELTTKKAKK